jgi:hypothetical protein
MAFEDASNQAKAAVAEMFALMTPKGGVWGGSERAWDRAHDKAEAALNTMAALGTLVPIHTYTREELDALNRKGEPTSSEAAADMPHLDGPVDDASGRAWVNAYDVCTHGELEALGLNPLWKPPSSSEALTGKCEPSNSEAPGTGPSSSVAHG